MTVMGCKVADREPMLRGDIGYFVAPDFLSQSRHELEAPRCAMMRSSLVTKSQRITKRVESEKESISMKNSQH
jgi:hypothetical protein